MSCCVAKCKNNSRRIDLWKKQLCDVHGYFFNSGGCICDPPFRFYPLPTERKNPDARKRWLENINFKKETGKPWTRICSIHFPDGGPTERYPDPILHMGQDTRPAGSSLLKVNYYHQSFKRETEDPVDDVTHTETYGGIGKNEDIWDTSSQPADHVSDLIEGRFCSN